MKSYALFPTVIWMTELHDLLPMIPDWKTRLDKMRASESHRQARSTKSGWSGPKTVFDDPAFEALGKSCQNAFAEALKELSVPKGFRFALEAWGNIHDPGGFNQPHIHIDAVLSGCFYLHTPTGSGNIVFHDPRPATLFSRRWGSGMNSWKKLTVTVKEGNLILFPNWLEHSVEENKANECRYSIAMNAILPRI